MPNGLFETLRHRYLARTQLRICKSNSIGKNIRFSWLIQYAGEQGEGIANEDHAQRLLIQALRYGQPNDVLNALSYLPTTSTKEGWDECSRIANDFNPQ